MSDSGDVNLIVEEALLLYNEQAGGRPCSNYEY